MSIRAPFMGQLLLTVAFGGTLSAAQPQDITLQNQVQIPEAVLAPGSYTIALEDRMSDRVVVRISDSAKGEQHLVLAVSNPKLKSEASTSNGLVSFQKVQALRGWKCPECKAPLEFVYPKAEAAKLMGDSGQSVLAFDPSYDKLPENLSPEDRKVVTLWLLSPKRVTAAGRGEGVAAAKYSQAGSAPGAATSTEAAAAPRHRTLPTTASPIYSRGALGIALLALAGILRMRRRFGPAHC